MYFAHAPPQGLFPPSWRVALALSRDFCAISNKHLEEILDQSRGSLDVAVRPRVYLGFTWGLGIYLGSTWDLPGVYLGCT